MFPRVLPLSNWGGWETGRWTCFQGSQGQQAGDTSSAGTHSLESQVGGLGRLLKMGQPYAFQ